MVPTGYSLDDLQHITPKSAYYTQNPSNFGNLRLQSLEQVAEELGMQTALAMESENIDRILEVHSHQLDKVFNFRLITFNDNVLPPVITSANNTFAIDDVGQNIRIGGQTYQIQSQVRFVATPPSWRDYLWMSYPYPDYPDKSLLPKTAEENAAWAVSIKTGWDLGLKQAVSIYNINLDRLLRDFNGMLLYRKLLVQDMVSPYHVSKQNLGVTGDNHAITIDDQAWQIDIAPALQVHSQYWLPVLISEPTTNQLDMLGRGNP